MVKPDYAKPCAPRLRQINRPRLKQALTPTESARELFPLSCNGGLTDEVIRSVRSDAPSSYPRRLRAILLRAGYLTRLEKGEGRAKVGKWSDKAWAEFVYLVNEEAITSCSAKVFGKLATIDRARIFYHVSGGRPVSYSSPPAQLQFLGYPSLRAFQEFVLLCERNGWLAVIGDLVCWKKSGCENIAVDFASVSGAGLAGLFKNRYNLYRLLHLVFAKAGTGWMRYGEFARRVAKHFNLRRTSVFNQRLGSALAPIVRAGFLEKEEYYENREHQIALGVTFKGLRLILKQYED